MSLLATLSSCWQRFQADLFPGLRGGGGPLSERREEGAAFSVAFADFAAGRLPMRLHETLIATSHKNQLVGHISRDATAIEAREKPGTGAAPEKPKGKRGTPARGEE